MLTKDEKKMLRVVAAYNETTEEQAEKAIVKNYLQLLLKDPDTPISNMELPIVKEEEHLEVKAIVLDENGTTIVKQRKNPGPKPKKKTVNDVAREIEETERDGKMSRDEFVDYFSQRGEA